MLTVYHCKTFWCSLSRCGAARFLFEPTAVAHRRNFQQSPDLLSYYKVDDADVSQIFVEDGSRTCFRKHGKDSNSTLRSTTNIAIPSHQNKFNSLKDSDVYLQDKIMIKLPRRCRQKKYFDMIIKLLQERRLSEALDVVQVTMLKRDCVKPDYYIYSILIKYCGLIGHPDMAFKLYTDMMKQGLFVEQTVYLHLFLSVGNCSSPNGLQAIRDLLAFMNEKGVELETKTCWAALRAFGQCGSIEDGIRVLDYMETREMYIPLPVISYLFRACVLDKLNGFRYVLLLYKTMVKLKIKPEIYQFNNLLHCTRDCHLGSVEKFVSVLNRFGLQNDDRASIDNKSCENVSMRTNSIRQPPNVLSDPPTLGFLRNLANIKTAQDRLFLLGGAEGVIGEMIKCNVEPDSSAVCYLLQCGPNTISAETKLLEIVERLKVPVNVRFFNGISRRRVRRQEHTEAKEVLTMLKMKGLEPDKYTFDILSMTCKDVADAMDLLDEMDSYGLKPTVVLLNCFLMNAFKDYQMDFINVVLDIVDREQLEVDSRFITSVENFFKKCLNIPMTTLNRFPPEKTNGIQEFCKKYPKWRSTIRTRNVN